MEAGNSSSDSGASAGDGITDHKVVCPVSLGLNGNLPAKGVPFEEPIFGTTLMRVTDQTDQGSYATHEYSQLQAFSPSNEYMLLSEDDNYVVRRTSDLILVQGIDSSEWNTPRWQPGLTNTIVTYDTNADTTLRVNYTEVDTGITQTVYTFPERFERIRSNQSFDELSEDGRWMTGMASAGNDQIIFALDLEAAVTSPTGEGPIGTELSLNGLYSGTCQPDPQWGNVEPDWIAPSPLGNYLVVQWVRDDVTRCSGLELFDKQTGEFVGRVNTRHDHGDLGIADDGTEVFVSTISSSPEDSDLPAIVYYNLPLPGQGIESTQANLIKTIPWHGLEHVSCRGPRGLCLVTAFSPESDWGFDGIFDSELYFVFLDGSYRRLAHHRSSSCGYWVQPRATMSLDGSRILFASDFWVETGGQDSCKTVDPDLGGGEVYMIIDPSLDNPDNAGIFTEG